MSNHEDMSNAANVKLINAAKDRNLFKLKTAIKNNADVNYKHISEDGEETAMHISAHKSGLPLIRELISNDADIDALDSVGITPLSLACYNGALSVVKELLKFGADVNIASQHYVTPLHMAAMQGHLNVGKELLKTREVNINAEDEYGRTALFIAIEGGKLGIARELLIAGATTDNKAIDKKTVYDIAADNPTALILLRKHAKGPAAKYNKR